MTVIDYPALLAQLEQQRNALDDERQDIDAIIDTVRRRASGMVPAGLTLPPARNGGAKGKRLKRVAKPKRTVKSATAKPGKPTRTSKVTDAIAATMRRQYEMGENIDDIGGRAGVSGQTVRNYAAAGGWKRPKKAAKAAAAAARTGTKLGGSITCNWCQLKTEYDPCEKCGKTLKRSWT